MWKSLFGKLNAKEEDGNVFNRVDLCFVVDNTGSMGPFIEAAKSQLMDVIERLSKDSLINLHVALVVYRDHPPQDTSFITKVSDLTGDYDKIRRAISAMKPDGGGDTAEAVYQGVFDAVERVSWRDHSCRFAILVGDAPPHGFVQFHNARYPINYRLVESDGWSNGCPSNLDVHRVGAALERKSITLHAICQGKSDAAYKSFSLLSGSAGGTCIKVNNPQEIIDRITALLAGEFKDLEFDAQVFQKCGEAGPKDAAMLAEELATTRLRTAAALARLGKRGFFPLAARGG